MKIKSLIAAALLSCITLFAQTQFFTTSTTIVGPGVILKKVHAPTVPWIINVLEVDLQDPYIKMESVKANNRLSGYEATSSMAARSSYTGHRVVGAVNADFYGAGGVPIGSQIINGILLKTSWAWSSIGFDEHNRPTINTIGFAGDVMSDSGNFSITDVNTIRGSNELIVYNSFFGGTTATNIYGTEVRVSTIDGWIVNDTVNCIVNQVEIGIGSMNLPVNQLVLSGHGTASTYLNNIQIGDTIGLELRLSPSIPRLTQLVGGNYKFLEDGSYTGSTNTDRHPRTFIGLSSDSLRLFIATVDGRQPGSIGMNYQELADYMISIGAVHALNLDGGGSTTMIVTGQIENSLYQVERTVANALMVVSNAPTGTLNTVQVQPDNFRVFAGSTINIKTTSWDQYFNPVIINTDSIIYTVDLEYGMIDSAGNFTATDHSVSGNIVVDYQGLTDTAQFYVKSLQSITFNTDYQNTDNITGIQFPLTCIDEDNLPQSIPLSNFQWVVANPDIGYFDSTATFYGTEEGITQIIASYSGLSDTTVISVEIGYGTSIIDSMDVLDNWSLSGVLYDTLATTLDVVDQPSSIGSGSFRLHYQFIRSDAGRSWNYLDTDIPVYGLPDTILFDFKSNPGEHRVHMLVMVISDDNDELFQCSTIPIDTNFTTYKLAVDDFGTTDPNSVFHFPIRIKSIQIRLGYEGSIGDTNSGIIYYDNLQVNYPNQLDITDKPRITLPRGFHLSQNYPNPFNPLTTIQYELPQRSEVQIMVYDLLGRQVKNLVSETQDAGYKSVTWDAMNNRGQLVSAGVYFYQIRVYDPVAIGVGELVKTRKMVILK